MSIIFFEINVVDSITGNFESSLKYRLSRYVPRFLQISLEVSYLEEVEIRVLGQL